MNRKAFIIGVIVGIAALGMVHTWAADNRAGQPADSSEFLNAGTPAPTVSAMPQTRTEENSFEKAVYVGENILKNALGGNCAAVFDGEGDVAHYVLWQDGLNAYALDGAMQRAADLRTWQSLEATLCDVADDIMTLFDTLGHPDAFIVVELVDDVDYTTVLARIENGELVFDLVDATPAGEVISRNVYGEVHAAADLSGVSSKATDAQRIYIVNTSTDVFHLPGCSAADRIQDTNRLSVQTARGNLRAQGYTPCGICDP